MERESIVAILIGMDLVQKKPSLCRAPTVVYTQAQVIQLWEYSLFHQYDEETVLQMIPEKDINIKDLILRICKAFSIQSMEKYPLFHYLRDQLFQKHASFFAKYEKKTNILFGMMESEPVSSRDITDWDHIRGRGSGREQLLKPEKWRSIRNLEMFLLLPKDLSTIVTI